jgi:hypothetical protein
VDAPLESYEEMFPYLVEFQSLFLWMRLLNSTNFRLFKAKYALI